MKLQLLPVVLLFACGGPKKPDPVPHAPENAQLPEVRPNVANAANLYLRCASDQNESHDCNAIPYDVNVVGDQVECYQYQGALTLKMKSSGESNDGVTVQIAKFTGPDTYALDTAGERYINVSDVTSVATCVGDQPTGPATSGGKMVESPGRDKSCNSSGCSFVVAGTDPATPTRYQLTLTCSDLCESNSNLVCTPRTGGPITFSITTDCPPSR